jgi:glucose/arabinose dehydrogenase
MSARRSITLGAAAALFSISATACASDDSAGESSGIAGTAAGSTPSDTTTATADTTEAIAGSDAPATPAAGASTTVAPAPSAATDDPAVTLSQLGTFRQPVQVAWRPTDGASFVVEQAGRVVMMVDGRPGAIALDMTDLTNAEGERGLLGLAITKDGATAYVNYTDNDGDTRIDEYALSADGTFDPATRREVLAIPQPYPNHNGGGVVFGPDDMLYIGTGDGGSRADPERRALDLGELLGKMLRIDPRAGAAGAYTVPSDNPYVGVDGARPEIWSIGLRNPWRYSFDRSTGDLWIADVGQNQWEEVDVAWAADGAGKAANFGWSSMEGSHPFNADQSTDGVTPPIHEYEHVGGVCSISGGALYRGAAIPALVGWYVFADYCSGEVKALQIADRAVAKEVSLGAAGSVTAVSEGPDGELYVVTGDGPIFAITAG